MPGDKYSTRNQIKTRTVDGEKGGPWQYWRRDGILVGSAVYDEKGRSINLGEHLGKLEPGTVFYVVANEVRTLDGEVIRRPDKKHRVNYNGPHTDGDWEITV